MKKMKKMTMMMLWLCTDQIVGASDRGLGRYCRQWHMSQFAMRRKPGIELNRIPIPWEKAKLLRCRVVTYGESIMSVQGRC
jgi:hypothetical protein